MSEKHRFPEIPGPITCHAWNKDKSQVALSTNTHEVYVYKRVSTEWTLSAVLTQHELRVTGIDWAPNTNRIVTCAADRNAYVWSQTDDHKWKPTLVLLRINRAATCVKWSPKEKKFAVGSGARLISICYFDSENDWWVSKHIKKSIRSTITSLDWHPDNILLVAGSSDFKVRIFSGYIKDIEETPPACPWGSKLPLGHLIAEFSNSAGSGGGWVHCVRFSPDGNKVCWVGHNSSINVADVSRNMQVASVRVEYLPFLSCVWLDDLSVIVAGHSCIPLLYALDADGRLGFKAKLDNTQRKEAAGITAMRKFQSLDRQARVETSDTNLDSVHQNAVTCVCMFENNKFSTSGLDGQLVIWDFQSVGTWLKGLKIA